MQWLVLRITSGERFLCRTDGDLVAAVRDRLPVSVQEIYSITTITMMGPTGPSRMTMLEYPDLQDGKCLEEMMVLPASWYPITEDRAKKEISHLEQAMAESMKAREEMQRQQESQIMQARLSPMGPGGPGGPGGPHLGSLIKPPGMR